MKARMKNPVFIVPGALEALQALGKAIDETGLPKVLRELVHMRASQINGCSVCVDMHARALQKLGESPERIAMVGAWRHAPYYSDAERAALALTEAVTRMSDQSDAVPDALWAEATSHFDETELGALIASIAAINLYNRINSPTGQVSGPWVAEYI